MIGYWLGAYWYWYDIPIFGGLLLFNIYNLIMIFKK